MFIVGGVSYAMFTVQSDSPRCKQQQDLPVNYVPNTCLPSTIDMLKR